MTPSILDVHMFHKLTSIIIAVKENYQQSNSNLGSQRKCIFTPHGICVKNRKDQCSTAIQPIDNDQEPYKGMQTCFQLYCSSLTTVED